MSENVQFERYVDDLIERQIACGILGWNQLICSLPGVSPDVVWESLHRQQLISQIKVGDEDQPQRSSSSPFAYQLWRNGSLPTPHILDACWWFADASLEILHARLLANHVKDLVLLGTPTLFHYLLSRNWQGQLTLIDRQAAVCKSPGSHRVFVNDLLRDNLPDVCADAVIADAPWYEAEMKSFLWAARAFCQAGSTVFVSLPPNGTRPGIFEEKQRLLEWAEGLGLAVRSSEPGRLAYLSPPFEQNALKSSGAFPVPQEWRNGDLVTLSCVEECCSARPSMPDQTIWSECSVGLVQFRVRLGEEQHAWVDPSLLRLLPNDLLRSVSRRSPIRDQVDVWTSGNRVFQCKGCQVLLLVLRALNCGNDVVKFVENRLGYLLSQTQCDQILRVAQDLRQIIEQEIHEYSSPQPRDEQLELVAHRRSFTATV